jgi:hypothetical protein
MFVRNPIQPTLNAAKMIAKAVTNLQLFVNDEFILWGEIKSLKLEVVDFEPYFKTKTTIERINKELGTMIPMIMQNYANSILDDGW